MLRLLKERRFVSFERLEVIGETIKMFNVLVSALNSAWEPGQRMRMPRDRFREYSGDEAQAISLSHPASLKVLERVTTLLMYEKEMVEGAAGDVVRVGQLRDIQDDGNLTFRFA